MKHCKRKRRIGDFCEAVNNLIAVVNEFPLKQEPLTQERKAASQKREMRRI